jgi:hypothetical protein
MTLFAALNGTPIKRLELTIPYFGAWVASDLHLDRVVEETPAATLTLGGLTLIGTVFRSGSFVGSGAYRVSAGAGWSKTIPAQSYYSAGGVKASLVLRDAARAAGETLSLDADSTLGTHWIRLFPAPAVRVLDLVRPDWWVRPDGVTTTGPRPSPIVTSHFDVLPDGTALSVGRVAIATDRPEDWLPGVQFSSPTLSMRTVDSIRHVLDGNKLRTEVWTR